MIAVQTEEDVKIQHLLPFLERHGYSASQCSFELAVDVQEGRRTKKIFADVVVYADKGKKTPLLLCETKAPSEPLNKYVRDQAVSYARLLPKIAPICIITNGDQTQVYQTLSKSRMDSLPTKSQLQGDIVTYTISKDLQDALRAEAKHELFVIDDVDAFKGILNACHNEIRNNEGYDPAAAFDEMSKLLFCKMHGERTGGKNRFRLNVYDETLSSLGVNVVRQIYKETVEDAAYKGLFDGKSDIKLSDRTIRTIVKLFENVDLSLTAFDVKGEAFEYFLGDTFTGGLGEFFTPRNVVEFIADAVDPKIGEKIVDPFCGTGGFLMYAFEIVGEKIRIQDFGDDEKASWRYTLSNESLYGTDWKERTALACKMNMTVHGDGSSGIFLHHGLIDVPGQVEEGKFSLCLTNPPFGSYENDPAVLSRYELGKGRSTQDRIILGIERAIKLVKPGGRVGIVTIDGVLNNNSMDYVRSYIRKNCVVRAVISLNKETFEGYNARAKTSVLFLEKRPKQIELDSIGEESTFFAVAENTGYAANGSPVAGNQLPDILADYREFRAGRQPTIHTRVKLASIAGRMDAEYYVPNSFADDREFTDNIKTLKSEGSMLTKKVRELESQLADGLNVEMDTILLSDIFQEVSVKVKVEPDRSYSLVGVKWWGGGTFLRETKLGKNISAKSLFQLQPDLLIYNRLFAFRGSFAQVQFDHANFFVSNEFPMFKIIESHGRDRSVLLSYIVEYLNSPQMLAEVDRLSTGSTKQSRNRFYQNLFLSLTIQVPKDGEHMKAAVKGFALAATLKQMANDMAARLEIVRKQIGATLYHS